MVIQLSCHNGGFGLGFLHGHIILYNGGFVFGFGLGYVLQGSVMRIWILDWYDRDYIIH